MQLENLHKHVHLNKMANGTVEVLFAGQPALSVSSAGGDFFFTLNPVFCRLMYGANVFSDIPYCTEPHDSIEMAVAAGLEALDGMGAFSKMADIPEDTYAATVQKSMDDARHHFTNDLSKFAATNGASITESHLYIRKLMAGNVTPTHDAETLVEKFKSGAELDASEYRSLCEHTFYQNPAVYGENGLPVHCKMEFAKPIIQEHAIPQQETTVEATETALEATKTEKTAQSLFEKFKARKQYVAEGMRLISTHENGNRTAKVYKDSEWGEHRVKFYTDGNHHKEADYHTDDKSDATDTAKHWIKQGNVQEGVRSEFSANDFLANSRLGSPSDLKDHPLAKKRKEIRIVSPTGGTVFKHTDSAVVKQKYAAMGSPKSHKIVEDFEDGSNEDVTHIFEDAEAAYKKWETKVKEKHGDKGIKFKGRIESGVHTVSAEVPGQDRCYAVWDHDKNSGHIFEDEIAIVGEEFDINSIEMIAERELTPEEDKKREEIVTALKKKEGFVSKYGKDAIWAVATAQAKTASV